MYEGGEVAVVVPVGFVEDQRVGLEYGFEPRAGVGGSCSSCSSSCCSSAVASMDRVTTEESRTAPVATLGRLPGVTHRER
jgi:hypothetical protein